jgi:uncharacterized protein (TIRG00374 family)
MCLSRHILRQLQENVVKKGNIISILGVLISILFLYFSLRGIRFQEILDTLAKGDYRLLVLPLVFIFLAVTLSALRWSRVTGSGARFSDTFVALMIGLFVNNVLPARIGEVARGYVLAKKRDISFTYALSTVFVDRFFDLVGLLLITFLFFPSHSLPLRVSQGIYSLIGLLIACLIGLIALSREKFATNLAEKLARINKPLLSRLAKRILEVQENLKRIQSPLNLLYFVIISMCTWLSMALALYFVVLMLGISIPFQAIPFVCALLNMGITIPSSPGYVGLYQFLLVYLLSIFGVPKHQGFTVSVIYHASWYIPYNVVGFIFLLKEHLKIREIRKLKNENGES